MGLQTVNNGSGYMPFWDGHFDVCTIAYRGYGLGNGQYIDLATLQNGYLTQNVTLPFNGTYALTYRRRYDHSNYLDFHMQIDWNGAIVASIIPTTENLVTDNISLIGMVGKNKLKFEEIGLGGV